jgi:hypothetical protein
MNYRDARKKIRLIQEQKIKEYSDANCEDMLKKLVSSRIETVFVGAISKIERVFGELWGENLDLDESQMSAAQKEWFSKFLDLRDEIFDQGNTEKKRIVKEIALFKISQKETKI